VPQKAHGGEIMDETSYRARGGEMQKYARRGEVERQVRGSSEYKAKSADEFLKMIDAAAARIKRMDSDLPYNPAPWHERTEEGRGPIRMTPDATIPKRRGFGFIHTFTRGTSPTYLEEGGLGTAQENYENEPTPENAREISKAAERLAKVDPKFSEEWRKNTSGRMGDLKAVDRYAHGGEVHCAHCGSVSFVPLKAMGGEIGDGLHGDMKEMYPSRKGKGSRLDDGKIGFAKAIKRR
jgi:hypothetical protein